MPLSPIEDDSSATATGRDAARTTRFRYKCRAEDFVVEELTREPPGGTGEHCWAWIEKRGLSTPEAERLLTSQFRLAPGSVRHAGQKDALAVTRQWLSLTGVEPEDLLGFEGGGLRVLRAERHAGHLRLGQLAGNRFRLVLRGLDESGFAALERGLDDLRRRGLPNGFGPQRYGARGDTADVGRALLEQRHADAVQLISGRPGPLDFGPVLAAREAFEAGRFQDAAAAFPRGYSTAARLARSMFTNRGRPKNALRALSKRELQFYVSALQSQIFDAVLAAREPDLGRLIEGDLVLRHAPPATFFADDLAVEQPRADALEISPSGPLFGRKMRSPRAHAAQFEREICTRLGLDPALFSAPGPLRAKGDRRALRLPLNEVELLQLDPENGERCAQLDLTLPPGTYATAVLAELHAGPLPAPAPSTGALAAPSIGRATERGPEARSTPDLDGTP